MPRCKIEFLIKYLTAPVVRQRLGLSRFQLDLRISRGILPAPTFIDRDTGVRYFDEGWLRIAKAIMENSFEAGRVRNEQAVESSQNPTA